MRSVYSWQIRGYLVAFAVLILSQIVVIAVGINLTLNAYTRNQLTRLQDQALEILLNPDSATESAVEHTGPFFVFSANRELVFSNRGKGRSIATEEYRPVRYDGVVIGYFYAEGVRFLSSAANQVFLASVGVLIGGSMIVSFGIAAMAAVRASRRISNPIRVLQLDIEALRTLRKVARRDLPVTELSAMSEIVQRVSDRLAGEEQYKRQWMQDIAHDLRTPIAGLRSQIEGMRDGVLKSSPERFAQTLAEIGRLEEMVTGMNHLHSIERVKSIEKTPLAAVDVVKELHSVFEARLREKDMEFVTDVQAPMVLADRQLLLRALGNIVENALTHAGDSARLTVSVDQEDARTVFRLANDGPTIPEDQLPKLFDRFYRGSYSRSSPGAGLGLNIAHEIVVLHAGSIEVENLTPRGVQFTISLPGLSPRG